MAEHCGQSVMPASHSCCQAPNRQETLVLQGQADLPLRNAIAVVPDAIHVHLSAVVATSSRCLAFLESPPNQPQSCSSSVLRI